MKKTYNAKLGELENIASDVSVFTKEIGANKDFAFAINLCLDEIFTNIVSYGYAFDESKKIEIEYNFVREKNDTFALIRVTDSARAFNPLDNPPPDTSSVLDKRNIGGLGIFFVKKNMDEVSYSRLGETNVLTMKKFFKKET